MNLTKWNSQKHCRRSGIEPRSLQYHYNEVFSVLVWNWILIHAWICPFVQLLLNFWIEYWINTTSLERVDLFHCETLSFTRYINTVTKIWNNRYIPFWDPEIGIGCIHHSSIIPGIDTRYLLWTLDWYGYHPVVDLQPTESATKV